MKGVGLLTNPENTRGDELDLSLYAYCNNYIILAWVCNISTCVCVCVPVGGVQCGVVCFSEMDSACV